MSKEVELFGGVATATLSNPRSMAFVITYNVTGRALVDRGLLQPDGNSFKGEINTMFALKVFAQIEAALEHIWPGDEHDNRDMLVKVWDIKQSDKAPADKFMAFVSAIDLDVMMALDGAIAEAMPDKYRAPEYVQADTDEEVLDPEAESAVSTT